MDGLLWEPVIYHTDAVEQQLQEQHICYQIFNGAIPDWYHDQFCQLGQIMTQQLVDLSHRTIAFVTQPSSTFSAPLCMGYEQCLYCLLYTSFFPCDSRSPERSRSRR